MYDDGKNKPLLYSQRYSHGKTYSVQEFVKIKSCLLLVIFSTRLRNQLKFNYKVL